MYTMRNPRKHMGEIDIKLVISVVIIQAIGMIMLMLKRSQFLGELIMMLT